MTGQAVSSETTDTQHSHTQMTYSVSGVSERPLGHYLTIHFEDFNLQNSSGCERDIGNLGKTIHLVSEICHLLSLGGGVCFHLLLIQPLKYPHFQERQEFVSYRNKVQIS